MKKLLYYDNFFLNESLLSDAVEEVKDQMRINKLNRSAAIWRVAKMFDLTYDEINKEMTKRASYKNTSKKIKTSRYDDFLRDN